MADDTWDSFPFTYDGVTREVYTLAAQGTSPDAAGRQGILIMHELGGITEETVEFAKGLTEAGADHNGFDVFIPVMFGRFRQGRDLPGFLRNLNNVDGLIQTMCVRAEFRAMQHATSSPIAGWMRAAAREIGERTGGPVGVVGMCLTGAVVFSMVWDPVVGGVVSAQPSLPLRPRDQRTVSNDDFSASAAKVKKLHEGGDTTSRVQLHHFTLDKLCREPRIKSLRDNWKAQTGVELDVKAYKAKGHATLTEMADSAENDDGKSREIVRAFFEEALR